MSEKLGEESMLKEVLSDEKGGRKGLGKLKISSVKNKALKGGGGGWDHEG